MPAPFAGIQGPCAKPGPFPVFHRTGSFHRAAVDAVSTEKLRSTMDRPRPIEILLDDHGQARTGLPARLLGDLEDDLAAIDHIVLTHLPHRLSAEDLVERRIRRGHEG